MNRPPFRASEISVSDFPEVLVKPEYQELREWAKDFVQREIAPIADKIDATDEYPLALARKMGKQGLLGLSIPQEYGGLGLGAVGAVIVAEEVAKVSLSAGLIIGVQNGLAGNAISKFGSEKQKEKYLPRVARGELICSFGLTEPGAGSDAAAISTKAERAGESYRINGSKLWISQGMVADLIVLFARTGQREDRGAGITAFIVERGTQGFRVGSKLEVMGLRGTGTAELVFKDCEIPASNLLGHEGEGFVIAMTVLLEARVGAAAGAVGIAEAALEASKAYAKKRVLFGKTLSSFESIQFLLADMATRISAAKLLTYRAAYLLEAGKDFQKEAAMAKVFSSETSVWACERAIQIHGGYGVSKSLPLERFLRDAKTLDIVEGASEVQRWILAKDLLGL